MGLKLKVSGLAWGTEEDALRAAFEEFGRVTAVKVARDWETGRLRRFAFVTFADDDEADDALHALQGAEVDGKPIRIEVAPGQVRRAPRAATPAPDDAPGAVPAAAPATGDAGDRAAEAARSRRREKRGSSRRARTPGSRAPGAARGGPMGPDESDTFG